MSASSSSPGPSRAPAVVAWSLYDLANTIYYLLVVTVFVPKLLAGLTGTESRLALSFVPATLLAAGLLPALSMVLARRGYAKEITVLGTALSCVGTAALALDLGWVAVSVCFGLSLFTYHLASYTYQSLLPHVAAPAVVGRVSGLGVALGYLGNILALVFLMVTELEARFGVRAVFLAAALLFAAFTIPLWRWVPHVGPMGGAATGTSAWGRMGDLLRQRDLRRYLVGNFLVCDGVNTILVQVARFAEQPAGLGLDAAGRNRLLIVINVCAVLGGLGMGCWGDRSSGRRTSLWAVGILMVAVSVAQFLPGAWLRQGAIAVLGGVGVAGVWSVGRLWLVQLVRPEDSAAAFSLYGLSLKASLISLPLFTWTFDQLGSYDLPILWVLLFLGAGGWCWWGTAGRRPEAVATPSAP